MVRADVAREGLTETSAFDGICAVLFDFDGTLVRQTIDFAAMRDGVLSLAESYRVPTDDLARLPALEIVAAAAYRLDPSDGARASVFRREAAEIIEAIEMAAAQVAEPYEGVPAALAALAEGGYGIGIVTRNCRRAVVHVLKRHPLVYHALITRDDTLHVKPDPRHLYDAAARLGVPIDGCLMCGDHPMDVAAGRAAGARTAAVFYAEATIQADAFVGDYRADLMIASVADLPGRLPALACRYRAWPVPIAGRDD